MSPELLAIARRLGFDTLETRNIDRLDFREIAVWQVREALQAAYEVGKAAREGHEESDDTANVRPRE